MAMRDLGGRDITWPFFVAYLFCVIFDGLSERGTLRHLIEHDTAILGSVALSMWY